MYLTHIDQCLIPLTNLGSHFCPSHNRRRRHRVSRDRSCAALRTEVARAATKSHNMILLT